MDSTSWRLALNLLVGRAEAPLLNFDTLFRFQEVNGQVPFSQKIYARRQRFRRRGSSLLPLPMSGCATWRSVLAPVAARLPHELALLDRYAARTWADFHS